jgi:hypothetical protein
MPKIRTYDVCIAWVECKPWWCRTAHFETPAVYDQPSTLLDTAIEEWNSRVRDGVYTENKAKLALRNSRPTEEERKAAEWDD